MHGMSRQIDPVPMGVAEAEVLLDQGKPRAAVARLKAADPSLSRRAPGASPTSDRALRVFARAIARTGGEAAIGFEGETSGEGAEGKRLDWATAAMRALSKKQPSDPGVTSDLAEVLAQSPAGREEAERLLADLEQADLVSTGQAYAALARLRETGESTEQPAFLGAARAALDHGRVKIDLARCERMTKDKSSCSAADPRQIHAKEPKPPVFAAPKPSVEPHVIRI